MKTKTKGIILFTLTLIYYIFLNIFTKQTSSEIKTILYIIWIIIFWTLVFWLFSNINFLKNFILKIKKLKHFKYMTYVLFFIFAIYASLSLFIYENSIAWIGFWIIIIGILIFIPFFYLIGLLLTKIELLAVYLEKQFNKFPIELQSGLILGIGLSVSFFAIVFVIILVGPLYFSQYFPNSFVFYLKKWGSITIKIFIISFILGVILGFINRLFGVKSYKNLSKNL